MAGQDLWAILKAPFKRTCKVCNNFDTRGHKRSLEGKDLWLDFHLKDLNDDCVNCDLLRRMIAYNSPAFKAGIDPYVRVNLEVGKGAVVRVGSQLKEDEQLHFTFYREVATSNSRFPTLGLLNKISVNPASAKCFKFIQDNLDRCLKTHDRCPNCIHSTLPTRLVHLPFAGTNPAIRLVQTKPGQCGTYITLSHCWGTCSPTKTTSFNLAERMEWISWSELTPVFRNAVEICRKLGIDYLWIDSLCIIQDVPEDWEVESAKLADYYGNSYVTISATSSPDGTVSFLNKRAPEWLPQEYKISFPNGTSEVVNAVRPPTTRQDYGPLTGRAWAWQESLLSNRILYYTTSKLVWRCDSEVLTEDDQHYDEFLKQPMDMLTHRGLAPAELSREQCLRHWHTLVTTYSACRLTYETDRLPALASAAAKWAVSMRSKYIAGHWQAYLVEGLCWHSAQDYSRPLRCASTQYLAPTWAWPSLGEPIQFDYTWESDSSSFVKDVECVTSGLSPYGRVSSGHLAINGPLVYLRLAYKGEAVKLQSELNQTYYGFELGNMYSGISLYLDFAVVEVAGTVRRAKEEDELAPFTTKVACLLLGRFLDSEYSRMLVLGPADDGNHIRLAYAVRKSTILEPDPFEDAKRETVIIV